MGTTNTTETTTESAPEAVDYATHDEAKAMFAENKGLAWVRTKLDDGRIGDLSRFGEFRAQASGQ